MSTYRAGYIEGKTKMSVYVSPEIHKALKLAAVERDESMGDIVERALRRELGLMIHWSELALFGRDNQPINDPEQVQEALSEFRRTGAMNGVFFERLGLPHEDEEDASTWGPESPEHVDWTGFPS